MKADVITEFEMISFATLFRREAGCQPRTNARASKIASECLKNAWQYFSVFDGSGQRWIKFKQCSGYRNLKNTSTRSDAVARLRSRLELAHRCIVQVRRASSKL